jgi:hypothetical protein
VLTITHFAGMKRQLIFGRPCVLASHRPIP